MSQVNESLNDILADLIEQRIRHVVGDHVQESAQGILRSIVGDEEYDSLNESYDFTANPKILFAAIAWCLPSLPRGYWPTLLEVMPQGMIIYLAQQTEQSGQQ